MKKIQMYAQIVAIPVNFTDEVALQYRRADPNNDQVIQKGHYQMEPQPWLTIRSRLPIRESYLEEVDGYLKNGKAANLGFSNVSFEVPDECEEA